MTRQRLHDKAPPPPPAFCEILNILLQLLNRCGTITVLKFVNIKSFGFALIA